MIARLLAVIAVVAAAEWAPAQGDPPVRDRTLPSMRTTEGALARRRMHGVLVYALVTVDHEAIPARAAFEALQKTLGVTFVVRYADDPLGYGIEPKTSITFQAENAPALDVLEAMLTQCSTPEEPCTWQLRKGFVELGTKRRLSLPAARETRLYDIVELKTQIPENMRDRRQQPDIGALDVVQEICENVEPGVWDYGQTDGREPAAPPDQVIAPSAKVIPAINPTVPPEPTPPTASTPHPSVAPTRPQPDQERRYVLPAKIAVIRYWRDVLIVHAPDYIHRQINGYPEPIRPDAVQAD